MPLVKTYGRQQARAVKQELWLTPDDPDSNVFSSPDIILDDSSHNLSQSIEKERCAKVKGGQKTKLTSKGVFSLLDDDSFKENSPTVVLSSNQNYHGNKQGSKARKNRNQGENPKILQEKNTNKSENMNATRNCQPLVTGFLSNKPPITQTRKRKDRLWSRLSRNCRKVKQEDGVIIPLGEKVTVVSRSKLLSSESESKSSGPLFSSSSNQSEYTHDASADLFESKNLCDRLSDDDLDSSTPDGKRQKVVKERRQKRDITKLRQRKLNRQNEQKGNSCNFNTSTPLSCTSESRVLPVQLDNSLILLKDDTSSTKTSGRCLRSQRSLLSRTTLKDSHLNEMSGVKIRGRGGSHQEERCLRVQVKRIDYSKCLDEEISESSENEHDEAEGSRRFSLLTEEAEGSIAIEYNDDGDESSALVDENEASSVVNSLSLSKREDGPCGAISPAENEEDAESEDLADLDEDEQSENEGHSHLKLRNRELRNLSIDFERRGKYPCRNSSSSDLSEDSPVVGRRTRRRDANKDRADLRKNKKNESIPTDSLFIAKFSSMQINTRRSTRRATQRKTGLWDDSEVCDHKHINSSHSLCSEELMKESSMLLMEEVILHTPKNKHVEKLNKSNFRDSLTPSRNKKTGQIISAKEKILKECGQDDVLPFTDFFTPTMLKKCVKIGEGVYGEVFRTGVTRNESVALKIIPIEGDFDVNEEPQKTFEEILPEIVISKELSSLSNKPFNTSSNFIAVNRIACVQGNYPKVLLTQWDKFDKKKGSDNERPDVFDENQLFIIFEFADGGTDLEGLELSSPREAVSILQQVAGALAVAESEYSFEHRDLHWGNVLIRKTDKEKINFTISGEQFEFQSEGVEVSIIDFTLSRLHRDGCTVFCDLSSDPTLYEGQGDYQFDIYRKMKDENRNEWEPFNPHTNVLWLHYITDKLLNQKTYPNSADSKQLKGLRVFARHLLSHSSAEEIIKEDFFQL